MRSKTLLALVIVATATGTHAQPTKKLTDLSPEDQERLAAARLLFGYGVDATEDKTAGTGTLSAKDIDEKKLRHYIVTYYKDAIAKAMLWPDPPSVNGRVYTNAQKVGGNAWVLSEPFTRKTMCFEIAKGIDDREYRKWLEDWCGYSAVYSANTSVVEWRGASVTWPANKAYHGDLTFDTKLWEGSEDELDPVLPIPALFGFMNAQRVAVQEALLDTIPADSAFFASAQKIRARNKEWAAKQEAAVAMLEKKQRGKSGGGVVFGTEWFHAWNPVEATTATIDCEGVYWKAYGPTKFAKTDVDYDWAVSVDKNDECQSDYYDDGMPAVILGGPVFSTSPDDCSQHLITAGKHKIEVVLYQLKHKKTGELSVRTEASGNVTVSERTDSTRGKVVAKGSITCETKGDALAKHFTYSNTR